MEYEATLKSIEQLHGQLEKLPKEEQKKKLAEKREELTGVVSSTIIASQFTQVPKSMLSPLTSIATTGLSMFFGFAPFAWVSYKEQEYNASFASRAHSNPNLYDAILQAAEILEKRNSRYLNTLEHSFNAIIRSVADEQALAEDIIAFCRVLPAVATKDPTKIDPNDIKVLLGDIIKRVLSSSQINSRLNQNYSTPVIDSGYCSWVKYTFSSETNIEKSCCTETKSISLHIKIKYFTFPTEADFRAALKRENI